MRERHHRQPAGNRDAPDQVPVERHEARQDRIQPSGHGDVAALGVILVGPSARQSLEQPEERRWRQCG